MGGLALGIVLASAVFHASWNFLAKRSQRKVVFMWLSLVASSFIFLPMFFHCSPGVIIGSTGWFCIFMSSLLHALYFWLLGEAYERGDLSLVYPLSRGSGPLFVPLLAVCLIGERLTLPGIGGIALVVGGIYVIHLESFSWKSFLQPLAGLHGGASMWALLTGGSIASYTLVDKVGVGAVYPPVYIYLMMIGSWFLLTPYVLLRERAWIKRELAVNKKTIIVVGFLSNFTYLVILFAMQMSKVSYVAAIREVSIVFSAMFGIVWLGEKHARQKLLGASVIAMGVIFIGLSR